MHIEITKNCASGGFDIKIRVPEYYLYTLDSLPIDVLDMMDTKQSIGIIEDAVIMALGYKRKRKFKEA